eukprot:s531_g3.t3
MESDQVLGNRRKRRRVITSSDEEGEADAGKPVATSSVAVPAAASQPQDVRKAEPAAASEPQDVPKAVPAAASQLQDVRKAEPASASEPQDVPKAVPAAASQPQDVQKAEPAAAIEPQDVPKAVPAAASQPQDVQKAEPAAASEPQDIPKAVPAAASQPQDVQKDVPKAMPAAASQPQDVQKAEPASASEPQDIPKEVAEPGASCEEPGRSVRPPAVRKPKPKASRTRKRPGQEASAVCVQEAGDQQDDGQVPAAKADPDNTEQGPLTSRKSPRVGPKKSPDVVKALRAAKRYLRTSGRAEDPIMRARNEVLSELSEEEASAFTEANASRKKGEWCFEVLSPKVEARLQKTGVPSPASQSTGAAGADVAAGPEPSEAPKDKDTTATEVQSLNQGAASTTQRDVVAETAVHEVSTAKPPPPVPSFAERTPAKAALCNSPAVPAVPPQPVNSRGRGQSTKSRPKAPAASDRKKLDLALSAEVVQGPPNPEGRRRFAPIRPASRPLGLAKPKQAAAPTADVAGGAVTFRASRARCRHANETRHGPHVICADCGEELRFDAWRLELVDDMDLQSI